MGAGTQYCVRFTFLNDPEPFIKRFPTMTEREMWLIERGMTIHVIELMLETADGAAMFFDDDENVKAMRQTADRIGLTALLCQAVRLLGMPIDGGTKP